MREVNERVEEVNEGFAVAAAPSDFVCECADETCIERMEMTVREYEALRTDGLTFAVLPDHVLAGAECVVERHERYWVVEKLRVGGAVATELNPRSRSRISNP